MSKALTDTSDLKLLLGTLEEAGRLALSYFRKPLKIWEKSPDNPVSAADIALDDFFRNTLCHQRPDYGWLSEESPDDKNRLKARRTWIIDPIDGTRAFLKGANDWGLSVALVEAGQPILAGFLAPAEKNFYWAQKNAGAFLNGAPIHVSLQRQLKAARILNPPQFYSDLKKAADGHSRFQSPLLSPINSIALRLCKIASNEADCCLSLRPKQEWDLAAASLILQEAGGSITDGKSAQLCFNQEQTTIPHLIASNSLLHDALCQQMAGRLNIF